MTKLDDQGTRVFISYARKDKPVRDRLVEMLVSWGFAPVFDQSTRPDPDPEVQLTPQDEFWIQLKAMIAASEATVFLVSTHSIASRVCDDEIAYARVLGRKIIPVLIESIDFNRAPERVRALNVDIDLSPGATQSEREALRRLESQLRTNMRWRREASRLMRQAENWDAEGRSRDLLLRSGAIGRAEKLFTVRPAGEPVPGPLLVEFLESSRAQIALERLELESSELNARQQTAEAMFERAMLHVDRADYGLAFTSLIQARMVASPGKLPDGYSVSLTNEGWARYAGMAAACLAVYLPSRDWQHAYAAAAHSKALTWFDGGRHCVVRCARALEVLGMDATGLNRVWQRDIDAEVKSVSGARSSAVFCAMLENHQLQCIRLKNPTEIECSVWDLAPASKAVAGLSDDGASLVLASQDEATMRIHVVLLSVDGDRLDRIAHLELESQRNLLWAGFPFDSQCPRVLLENEVIQLDRRGHLEERRSCEPAIGAANCAVSPHVDAVMDKSWDIVSLSGLDGRREILTGSRSLIADMQFTADGRSVLARVSDGDLLRWTRKVGLQRHLTMGGVELRQDYPSKNWIDPDNRFCEIGNISAFCSHPTEPERFLVASEEDLAAWRYQPPDEPVEELPVPPGIRVVVESSLGLLALATEKGLRVRSGPHDPMATVGRSSLIWDAAIGHGRIAASYPGRGTVALFDSARFGEVATLRFNSAPQAVAFMNSSGTLLIGTESGQVCAWNESGGLKVLAELDVGPISRIEIAYDDSSAVVVGRSPDHGDIDEEVDGIAAIETESGQLLWASEPYEFRAHSAALSADGRLIVVPGTAGAFGLDAKSGERLFKLELPVADATKPSSVTCARFMPDNRSVVLGGWDGFITIADLVTGRIYRRFQAHKKLIADLACDHRTGNIITVSHYPHQDSNASIWRAWDPHLVSNQCDDAALLRYLEDFRQEHGNGRGNSRDN